MLRYLREAVYLQSSHGRRRNSYVGGIGCVSGCGDTDPVSSRIEGDVEAAVALFVRVPTSVDEYGDGSVRRTHRASEISLLHYPSERD